jgi:hypothetical protein
MNLQFLARGTNPRFRASAKLRPAQLDRGVDPILGKGIKTVAPQTKQGVQRLEGETDTHRADRDRQQT